MKQGIEELEKVSQEAGKAIYEKAAQSHGGSAGGPDAGASPSDEPQESKKESGKDEENIIDADYEVKE